MQSLCTRSLKFYLQGLKRYYIRAGAFPGLQPAQIQSLASLIGPLSPTRCDPEHIQAPNINQNQKKSIFYFQVSREELLKNLILASKMTSYVFWMAGGVKNYHPLCDTWAVELLISISLPCSSLRSWLPYVHFTNASLPKNLLAELYWPASCVLVPFPFRFSPINNLNDNLLM